MSALLAMQLDTMIVLMFVSMAYIFRFMIKQLSYSLYAKRQCERQIEACQSAKAEATIDSSEEIMGDFRPAI